MPSLSSFFRVLPETGARTQAWEIPVSALLPTKVCCCTARDSCTVGCGSSPFTQGSRRIVRVTDNFSKKGIVVTWHDLGPLGAPDSYETLGL